MELSPIWYNERLADNSAPLTLLEEQCVRADYETVTGRLWSESFSVNCPNCYRDAITLICLKMKQNENKDSGGYVLKPGIVFKYKGKLVSSRSITKDAAEWYIKQDINNRDKFMELGRDYDSYEQNSPKTE